MATTTTIKGRTVSVGDELLMSFGRGTQRVRIRQIMPSGGVRIDRFNASRNEWQSPNTVVKASDPRW